MVIKYNIGVKFVVALILFVSSLALIQCNNVQSNTPAIEGKAPQDPKIETLSSTRSSLQGTIFFSSVAFDGPKTYLATQTGSGQLWFFDKAADSWKPLEGFPKSDWPLSSIMFIDETNGFVTGHAGTFMRTSDAGKSWMQAPYFSKYDLGKIVFSDSLNGYLVGELANVDEKSGALTYKLTVFRTDDAGNNWREVYSDLNAPGAVFDMTVRSSDVCLLAIGGKFLLRTSDGGKTWHQIPSIDKVNSIAFTSDGIGWLVNVRGDFLRSEDQGTTWRIPDKFPVDLARCQWESIGIGKSGFGLAVSEDGCVAFTDDGKKWKKMTTAMKDHLRNVVIQGQRGIIIGENNIYEIGY